MYSFKLPNFYLSATDSLKIVNILDRIYDALEMLKYFKCIVSFFRHYRFLT